MGIRRETQSPTGVNQKCRNPADQRGAFIEPQKRASSQDTVEEEAGPEVSEEKSEDPVAATVLPLGAAEQEEAKLRVAREKSGCAEGWQVLGLAHLSSCRPGAL